MLKNYPRNSTTKNIIERIKSQGPKEQSINQIKGWLLK